MDKMQRGNDLFRLHFPTDGKSSCKMAKRTTK